MRSIFYPKILLFGEHTLMLGSQALTIPFKRFRANLSTPTAPSTEKQRTSNMVLKSFFHFLCSGKSKVPFLKLLRLDAFEEDLSAGLFLESDVPSGYGLGSSGALVAAIFDRYTNLPAGLIEDPENGGFSGLREILAAMEDYFHGHSSGIDPLSSYLTTPLIQFADGSIKQAQPDREKPKQPDGFFLLDTTAARKTAPLVMLFKEKYQETAFRNMITTQYIPTNDRCIEAWRAGDKASLHRHINLLSRLQFTHFKELIPDKYLQSWSEGLTSGRYALKLCGAGGGGYILGFTNAPHNDHHPFRVSSQSGLSINE